MKPRQPVAGEQRTLDPVASLATEDGWGWRQPVPPYGAKAVGKVPGKEQK